MSPVVIALLARLLALRAVAIVGREAGRFLMRGAVVAALPRVPGAADAERIVESWRGCVSDPRACCALRLARLYVVLPRSAGRSP